MATYTIGAVHLVPVTRDRRHGHVDSVKLSTDEVLPKAAVIARIKAGDVFVTYHQPHAQVHVADCTICWANECLTTHPDSVTANNLLHMLTF